MFCLLRTISKCFCINSRSVMSMTYHPEQCVAAIIWNTCMLQFTRDIFLPKCFHWISSCVTRMILKSFMQSFWGKKRLLKHCGCYITSVTKRTFVIIVYFLKKFMVKFLSQICINSNEGLFLIQVFEVPYISQVWYSKLKNLLLACCLLPKKKKIALGTPLNTWLSWGCWNLFFCDS